MKISTTIPKLILVAFLLIPVFVLAQNQTISVNGSQIQISSMLQTVLNQAETVYIPSGFTMDGVYNDAPDMIPLFSGLIMQRQKNYMDQARNIRHIDNYFDLISQIDRFLSQLAKAHNYINPVGGSKMPPIQLQNSFMETIKGKYNDVYINKFGIDPTKVEIAYLLDRSPNKNNVAANQDDHAKIQLKDDEETTEINLFEDAVIGGANPPKKYAVKRKGGPGKAKGRICPEQSAKSFKIDTNGNPDDDTYCWCDYDKGFLRYQAPQINDKKHGNVLFYDVTKAGVRFLNRQTPYVNGKNHGEDILYSEYTYHGGRIGLRNVIPYVNGVRHGIFEDWYMTDSGINYLRQTIPYVNGVRHGEVKTFKYSKSGKYFLFRKESYRNIGSTSKSHGDHIIYGSNSGVRVIAKYNEGEFVSSKCFYKNGRQIKKGDPAASKSWKEEYSCDSSVLWDKTDW